MKRVLLTGGSGFIGRNVAPILNQKCILFAPNRQELNLFDEISVREYIKKNKIQVIIHSANPNPIKNPKDSQETMFEDSIRIFMNLYKAQDYYEMMYTMGSGAEYDKTMDICQIEEACESRSIPKDSYGLAKYTINQIIKENNKQCNLRIFACYGPTDHESKFITHCINCCKNNQDITIRQNCYFDYMQVQDLGKILVHFINNGAGYRSYNVCSGVSLTLLEIAKEVRKQMKVNNKIIVFKEGYNKEYTGSNKRLLEELGDYKFININEGIKIQIESELEK